MLLWEETFDSLRPDRWNIRTGNWLPDAQGNPSTPGWGNGELQYYVDDPDTVYCQDHTLHIRARKQAISDATGRYAYTSARIDTRDAFSFCYGHLTFTAKLPTGAGLWPAVWLMPQDNTYGLWAASGEIDILEARGRLPGQVSHALHFGGTPPDNTHWTQAYDLPQGQSTADWHEYRLTWTPEGMSFLVDGAVSARITDWHTKGRAFPAPFDQRFYLLINLAVGGWFDRDVAVDEKALPATLQVGPIRVHSL